MVYGWVTNRGVRIYSGDQGHTRRQLHVKCILVAFSYEQTTTRSVYFSCLLVCSWSQPFPSSRSSSQCRTCSLQREHTYYRENTLPFPSSRSSSPPQAHMLQLCAGGKQDKLVVVCKTLGSRSRCHLQNAFDYEGKKMGIPLYLWSLIPDVTRQSHQRTRGDGPATACSQR